MVHFFAKSICKTLGSVVSHTAQDYKVAYMLILGLNGLLQLGACLGQLPVETLYLHPGRAVFSKCLATQFYIVGPQA